MYALVVTRIVLIYKSVCKRTFWICQNKKPLLNWKQKSFHKFKHVRQLPCFKNANNRDRTYAFLEKIIVLNSYKFKCIRIIMMASRF